MVGDWESGKFLPSSLALPVIRSRLDFECRASRIAWARSALIDKGTIVLRSECAVALPGFDRRFSSEQSPVMYDCRDKERSKFLV